MGEEVGGGLGDKGHGKDGDTEGLKLNTVSPSLPISPQTQHLHNSIFTLSTSHFMHTRYTTCSCETPPTVSHEALGPLSSVVDAFALEVNKYSESHPRKVG